MVRWLLIAAAILVVAVAGYYYFFGGAERTQATTVRFAPVTRGSLTITVTATGQIEPVTKVDVGTQVSGTLDEILVDYNSPVKARQVLARLDTRNLEARVAANRASLRRAEASLERTRVERTNAQRQYERNRDLASQGLATDAETDDSRAIFESLNAQIAIGEAEIEQARTSLEQSEIDLGYATITSPIDGVVIERAVEVGQTVAASFNAPLLFRIANDLSQMQIRANIDEADIGRVQAARGATFTVDAFAGRMFSAKLAQIRLNPAVTNNVVIYTCIFSVENREPDGALGPLLPGLTANLTILIDERTDVLQVPAAALRFQPKGGPAGGREKDVATTGDGAAGARSGTPRAASANGPPVTGLAGDAAVASNGSPEKASGDESSGAGKKDQGTVWMHGAVEGDLRPVRVEIGLTDGLTTEVRGTELNEGDEVAIGHVQESSGASSGSLSPFGGTPQRGGGGGGGGGRSRMWGR